MLTKGWVVFACGCTDCFPEAIFFIEDLAYAYGQRNCKNPEGFIVKEIDVSSLSLRDD